MHDPIPRLGSAFVNGYFCFDRVISCRAGHRSEARSGRWRASDSLDNSLTNALSSRANHALHSPDQLSGTPDSSPAQTALNAAALSNVSVCVCVCVLQRERCHASPLLTLTRTKCVWNLHTIPRCQRPLPLMTRSVSPHVLAPPPASSEQDGCPGVSDVSFRARTRPSRLLSPLFVV